MLPFGYNPENYNGKIWWNENNPEMSAIWGTQSEYDKFISQGGNWDEYVNLVRKRMDAIKKLMIEEKNHQKKR